MNLICHFKLLSTDTASAKEHGLGIITWTLERTGPGLAGWYWQSVTESVAALDPKEVEGYRLALLHVLSQDVGVLGVFSDWPATTTFYANCMGLVSEEEEEEEDPGSGPFGGKAGKTAKTAKDGKLFKSHED